MKRLKNLLLALIAISGMIFAVSALPGCWDDEKDSGDDDDNDDSSDDDDDSSGGKTAGGYTCTGENPFENSCLNSLDSCFNPTGKCTFTQSGTDMVMNWENGNTLETSTNSTSMETTITAKDGETVCFTGVNQFDMATYESTTTYEASGKTYVITTNQAGDMTIKCPDGTTESYKSADLNASGCKSSNDSASCTKL